MTSTMETNPGPGANNTMPWARVLLDQGIVNDEIINYPYQGHGEEEDPYLVTFIPNDPRDPMKYPLWRKAIIGLVVAFGALAVSLDSSIYVSGEPQIAAELGGSTEVNTLGVSLFVAGIATGPGLWAPLSELYGRQRIFVGSFAVSTLFTCVCAASQTLGQLIVFRFFAGAFGAASLTNSGATIADVFPPAQRGIVLIIFAAAPFLGPIVGPIAGGFIAENAGWRWLMGVAGLFTGLILILAITCVPETYAPVLLRKRAEKLSKITGKVFVSKADYGEEKKTPGQVFRTTLLRPWIMLAFEPIVLFLSLYQALIFGTLYLLFTAYPIVYGEVRGWNQGIQGLSYIGILVGLLLAVFYCLLDNKRFVRVSKNSPSGFAPPEARLPAACVGAVLIPIGMFWFAWTNSPSIHWFSSVAAGAPFGFGFCAMALGVTNYLVDSYTIYAASVIACGVFGRAICGAAFPLFSTYMYNSLGIHWASSIPGFLAALCMPFPFILYIWGPAIRKRCKYAAEADRYLQRIRGQDHDHNRLSNADAAEMLSEESIPGSENSVDDNYKEKKQDEKDGMEMV